MLKNRQNQTKILQTKYRWNFQNRPEQDISAVLYRTEQNWQSKELIFFYCLKSRQLCFPVAKNLPTGCLPSTVWHAMCEQINDVIILQSDLQQAIDWFWALCCAYYVQPNSYIIACSGMPGTCSKYQLKLMPTNLELQSCSQQESNIRIAIFNELHFLRMLAMPANVPSLPSWAQRKQAECSL